MFSIPRAAVRAFRAVVHKGVAGRAREPAPPVVLIPDGEAVTMLVHLPSISIAYRVATEQPGAAPAVLPMTAFDAAVGAGHDPITLEPKGKLGAELRWNERGQGKTQAVELERFGTVHERPVEPSIFAPMPAEFLTALHEAGRTTGAANGRYALDRIQVKGKNGSVVASDGHRALLYGGFRFPFKEGLLIPALPIFGTAELAKETEIAVGRTDTHLVVRIGPWTFYLVLDATGRYPDVASVVPKAADTILELDDLDARELLTALPKLPGAGEERRPVTLDLAPRSTRGRAGPRGGSHPESFDGIQRCGAGGGRPYLPRPGPAARLPDIPRLRREADGGPRGRRRTAGDAPRSRFDRKTTAG